MLQMTVEAQVKYWGPYDGGIDDLMLHIAEKGLLGKARKKRDYELLYCLAQTLGGPVLEQGACYGLSTRCILHGLRSKACCQSDGWRVYSVDLDHQWNKHFVSEEGVYDCLGRVEVTADAGLYCPPVKCVWGFEDASHTFEGTKGNLQRQIEAGCHTILIHDTAEWRQGPCGDFIWDCRRAVLEVLADWDLIDVESESGMILAQRKEPNER